LATNYEQIRDAIAEVIGTADTGCPAANILKYRINPIDQSPEKVFQILGKKFNAERREIWAWMISRSSRVKDANEQGVVHDLLQGRSITEDWGIEFYKSIIDPVNLPEGSSQEPSEYEFQNIANAVVDEFWGNLTFANLAVGTGRVTLESTVIQEIGIRYVAQETLCHYANIVLSVNYNKFVAQ
jgi:hypothetical protein